MRSEMINIEERKSPCGLKLLVVVLIVRHVEEE
jgi:hypothetical protein